jgi:phage tail-like protein
MSNSEPTLSVFFAVKIDDNDLGTFNSCEGLGCEVVIEQREEGGNNGFIWQLPSRLKYSNVKFTRPLGPDTAKVASWFASLIAGVKRRTATIQVMSGDGTVVATWSLDGVIPVRWTGPSLSHDSRKVTTETIEIAHHGFLNS